MKMSKFINKLALIPLFMALISSPGCKNCSGFDASALKADAAINYGQMVKNHEIPVEAIVYGQLRPDDGGGGSITRSEVLLDNIVKDIDNIKKLDNNPDLSSFGDSLAQEFKTNFDILNVHNSAKAAKALALSVEPYIKTSGKLPKLISDGEHYVPDNKKGSYRELSAQLTKDVQSFYQTALGLSLALSQQNAVRELSSLATITKLLTALMNETLFATQADKQAAQLALLEVEAKRNDIYTYALKFVDTEVNVATSFTAAVNSLKTALLRLKTDYIAKADAAFKSDVDGYYVTMENALNSLENLALDYPAIEGQKTSSDAEIETLIAGLKNTALAINVLPNKTLTDINQLTKKLGDHNVVIIPVNKSSQLIAYALASSVVYHIAKEYGLPTIDNVIGIDADKLNDVKKDLNLSNADFNTFLASYADKLAKEYHEGSHNNYNNIFVIKADDIDGDVLSMLESLTKSSKVLVITSHPDKYNLPNKSLAQHNTLKIGEAMTIALAILQEQKAPQAVYIAERLVKIAAAFNLLVIGNIRALVLDVLARLPEGLDQAVDNALAHVGVAKEDVVNSGVEVDAPVVVAANISASSSHYVIKAKRPTSDDMFTKKLQAMRALNDSLLLNTLNQDLVNNIGGKQTKLNDALSLVKAEYDAKKSLYDLVQTDQKLALDNFLTKLNQYLSNIIDMLDYCSVPESNNRNRVVTDVNAEAIRVGINNKFDEAIRKNIADARFNARPLPNDKLGRATLGKPDKTIGEEESLASCLVFNPAYKPNGASTSTNAADKLRDVRNNITNYVQALQSDINACYRIADFSRQYECLENKKRRFDEYRQSLALNDNMTSSILRDLTKIIATFPTHKSDANKNERDIFWNQAYVGATSGDSISSGFLNSLSRLIEEPLVLTDAYKKSFLMLNQTYYIRELAHLTGSHHGLLWLSDHIPANAGAVTVLSPTSLLDTILNPLFPVNDTSPVGTENNRYYFHLKETLSGFDDNDAELVKVLREVNQGYNHVVAYHLVNIIYNDIMKKVVNQVAQAFWLLPLADLKQFQENGPGVKAIRKNIWQKIADLAGVFTNLAPKLAKPLVALGDGKLVVGDPADANTSGLMELGKAYVALRTELIALQALIDPTTPAINTLDAGLQAKLTAMHTALSNVITAMDLNNANPPWAAMPGAYASPTGAIAQKFMQAFFTAYDLHVYNFFKMNGQSFNVAAGNPERAYPLWHEKNNTIVGSFYDLAKIKTDAEAKATALGATAADATNIVNAAAGAIANSYASMLAAAKAAKGAASDKAYIAATKEVFERLKKGNAVRHPLELR